MFSFFGVILLCSLVLVVPPFDHLLSRTQHFCRFLLLYNPLLNGHEELLHQLLVNYCRTATKGQRSTRVFNRNTGLPFACFNENTLCYLYRIWGHWDPSWQGFPLQNRVWIPEKNLWFIQWIQTTTFCAYYLIPRTISRVIIREMDISETLIKVSLPSICLLFNFGHGVTLMVGVHDIFIRIYTLILYQ